MTPHPAETARSHRLRSLADMAGGMAHEFNQPLTAIRGCAENLLIARQRGWQLPPERIDDKLATIIAQCDRISGLIDHMRAFACGADDLRLAPTDLAEAAEDALRLMRSQLAARGISIAVENTAAGRPAQANRPAVAEVMVELLRNARDAITRTGRSQGRVTVSIAATPDGLALAVADDGVGMAAAQFEAAMEPFHASASSTTAGSGSGSGPGLGLAMARHTVTAMGGRLAIDSTPGHGATVTLLLPAA